MPVPAENFSLRSMPMFTMSSDSAPLALGVFEDALANTLSRLDTACLPVFGYHSTLFVLLLFSKFTNFG